MGEGKSEKGPYYVGAKRNNDGSIDSSRAMKAGPDAEKKMNQFADQKEKEGALHRASTLEIPEDVKPGTSTMVWYRLRNAIILNEERIDKARQQGNETKRLVDQKEFLEIERGVLEDVDHHRGVKIKEQLKEAGEDLSDDNIRQILRGLPAVDTSEALAGRINDWENDIKEDDPDYQINVGRNEYYISDVLKAAKSLDGKLIDEGSRFK